LTAYRFCRSDDMGLLAEAYERCRGPEDEGEPPLDREGVKRLIREIDLWCSSCMVAFEGREPVGVLLGCKRPESTLVHALRVHPDHRRTGHSRHLLTSLSQKLAILGPPDLVAEVPAGREPARGVFAACSFTLADRLTDWHRPARGPALPEGAKEALAPVGYTELADSGLLGEGVRCWRRDRPALAKHQEYLSGLAFHSPDRIEAWALWRESEPGQAWPIQALGAVPGNLGRLGLTLVLDELAGRAGAAPLLLERAASGEIEVERLEELGFVPGEELLRFASRAQAA